jgi:hypothetical protein
MLMPLYTWSSYCEERVTEEFRDDYLRAHASRIQNRICKYLSVL